MSPNGSALKTVTASLVARKLLRQKTTEALKVRFFKDVEYMVIIVTREFLANRYYIERPHATRMLRASDYYIRGVLHFLEH